MIIIIRSRRNEKMSRTRDMHIRFWGWFSVHENLHFLSSVVLSLKVVAVSSLLWFMNMIFFVLPSKLFGLFTLFSDSRLTPHSLFGQFLFTWIHSNTCLVLSSCSFSLVVFHPQLPLESCTSSTLKTTPSHSFSVFFSVFFLSLSHPVDLYLFLLTSHASSSAHSQLKKYTQQVSNHLSNRLLIASSWLHLQEKQTNSIIRQNN